MTKLYVCSYAYKGKNYSFHIPASSKKDAQTRLKAVAQGAVDGEWVFTKNLKSTPSKPLQSVPNRTE